MHFPSIFSRGHGSLLTLGIKTWFARETLDLPEMKTESSSTSRQHRWSADLSESRVRSDQAKLSLRFEKKSACAAALHSGFEDLRSPNKTSEPTAMTRPPSATILAPLAHLTLGKET
jgi:hypothetical protein